MEYHIQNQRENGRLAKKIQHFENSVKKLCIEIGWKSFALELQNQTFFRHPAWSSNPI